MVHQTAWLLCATGVVESHAWQPKNDRAELLTQKQGRIGRLIVAVLCKLSQMHGYPRETDILKAGTGHRISTSLVVAPLSIQVKVAYSTKRSRLYRVRLAMSTAMNTGNSLLGITWEFFFSAVFSGLTFKLDRRAIHSMSVARKYRGNPSLRRKNSATR